MQAWRCGFIPESEWRPGSRPVELGGVKAHACPTWYHRDPAVASEVRHVLDLELSGVQLTLDDPAPLIQAFATIRGARNYSEAQLVKAAKTGAKKGPA